MRVTCLFCFFNDTATTEIYTLSLHDALPICPAGSGGVEEARRRAPAPRPDRQRGGHARRVLAEVHRGHRQDRKSTRLNSSHANISYAVFCLKKKSTMKKDNASELRIRNADPV